MQWSAFAFRSQRHSRLAQSSPVSSVRKSANTNGASRPAKPRRLLRRLQTKEISDPCSKSKGGKSHTECFAKNEAASYANARAEISEKEVGQRSIRQICKIKVRSKRRGNAKAEKNTAAASRKRAHRGRDRKPATTGDCCTNTSALATTSASTRRFSDWASAGRH